MDKRVKKEGTVPKNARKELESQTGKNVVTGENFLNGDTESRTLNGRLIQCPYSLPHKSDESP